MLVYQFRTALSDARELARTATLLSPKSPDDLAVQVAAMHAALQVSFQLIAVALGIQVILLFSNKASQFAIAHADDDSSKWSRSEKFWEWFSRQYIFDAVCDLFSVTLLGCATYYGIAALHLT